MQEREHYCKQGVPSLKAIRLCRIGVKVTWHASDWPDNVDSTVAFEMLQDGDDCILQIFHQDVPVGSEDEYRQGWLDNYINPLHDKIDEINS